MTKAINLLKTKYNTCNRELEPKLTAIYCYSCSNSHSKHSLQCIAMITGITVVSYVCCKMSIYMYHLEYEITSINNLRFFYVSKEYKSLEVV